MISVTNHKIIDYDKVLIDEFWNTGDEKEIKMHRIHSYPAKFPAFITSKSILYAKRNGYNLNCIADIFCGCGTVALEAKRSNINFWGCDINPVATLIAKTKSRSYDSKILNIYFKNILTEFKTPDNTDYYESNNNQRLKYWYDKKHFNELVKLKQAIGKTIPINSEYNNFFLCAFSNILKSTSHWLTKSIKPQIDPNKKPINPIDAFTKQFQFMFQANNELIINAKSVNKIVNCNIIKSTVSIPKIDMIITSPPYVTSYEYADIHQLSSMWLGYSDDFRTFRKGSIGSLYHSYNFESEFNNLNETGMNIVKNLIQNNNKSKAKSVAKYFLDMQLATKKSYDILNKKGLSLFVIGDTEYKGIRINNAQHLVESLLQSGYSKVIISKRKISKKILTPYRNINGRFTKNSNGRKVYNEEYILIGVKNEFN